MCVILSYILSTQDAESINCNHVYKCTSNYHVELFCIRDLFSMLVTSGGGGKDYFPKRGYIFVLKFYC